jgi:hypothetical protein
MGEANHADVWAALRDPAVVHGMCEDYRAGLTIDRAHEEADRAAGRRVACPTLLLTATEDDIDIHGDAEAIWRPWIAGEFRRVPIHLWHHQAEQAPDEVASHCSSSSPPEISRPVRHAQRGPHAEPLATTRPMECPLRGDKRNITPRPHSRASGRVRSNSRASAPHEWRGALVGGPPASASGREAGVRSRQ